LLAGVSALALGSEGLMVTIGSEIVGLEILPDERTYKSATPKTAGKVRGDDTRERETIP